MTDTPITREAVKRLQKIARDILNRNKGDAPDATET